MCVCVFIMLSTMAMLSCIAAYRQSSEGCCKLEQPLADLFYSGSHTGHCTSTELGGCKNGLKSPLPPSFPSGTVQIIDS